MKYIQIHPNDNVAVMLEDLAKGEKVSAAGGEVVLSEPVQRGHKIALQDIEAGSPVIKYGNVIALATTRIKAGDWVHTHNAKTNLSENDDYVYEHVESRLPDILGRTFQGYLRKDGRAAIRNELWIIPTVGCVNSVAGELVKRNQHLVKGSIDGLYTFPHPFGCSQLGEDHEQTRKLLAALVKHPNAGGVLVLGLGCENLTLSQFQEELGAWDPSRVKFLVCQNVEDELEEGGRLLAELADYAGTFEREEISADKLVIGMKCGGSDGLSGITANPTVGRFSDYMISIGGSTVLTEVPEMFGAESILFNRCQNQEVFDKAVSMVNDFKAYFVEHGQVVYENPSPGNKAGGITTLEDKSCGCVQKGGHAQVVDVLRYGEQVTRKGLNLLSGPGNDLVSATNLTAAGAHMILFTTGRGTPFGAPAPTIKIATNTALAEKKSGWIDFNAGTVAEGEPLDEAGLRLLDYVLAVAGGEKTQTEKRGYREISIFKDGVVL
ncbi:MAG: altronate dehydratase family protein [Clostridiales bacterium]|nr:altronate dehydratase family protein [Clostridiales bacterium]